MNHSGKANGGDELPIFPMEVIARILRSATPATVAVCKRVCRAWRDEGDRVLSGYSNCDWVDACVREIPETVLYQLVYSLGLNRNPSPDGRDGRISTVHWRNQYPESFLESVPVFGTDEVFAKAEEPSEVTFDGQKVYKAWYSARFLLKRVPVMTCYPLFHYCDDHINCLKVTVDVAMIGLRCKGAVLFDLETGTRRCDWSTEFPGPILGIHLVNRLSSELGNEGPHEVPCYGSSKSHHNIALFTCHDKIIFLNFVVRYVEYAERENWLLSVDLCTGMTVFHLRFQGPYSYCNFLPGMDEAMAVGPQGVDVLSVPPSLTGLVLRDFFNSIGDMDRNPTRAIPFRRVPAQGGGVAVAPADLTIFRSDAIVRLLNDPGTMEVSVDGETFVRCLTKDDPLTEVVGKITCMDVLGDLVAWGTDRGVVGAQYLGNSANSLLQLNLRRPHFRLRLAEVDGMADEKDISVKGLSFGFSEDRGWILVVAAAMKLVKIFWK